MSIKEFQHTILPIKNTLFRLAKRVVGEATEAEDVVQEVLIKIWDQRKNLTEIKNIEAWCMRVTKNLSIDKTRSKHHQTQMLQSDFDQTDRQQNPYEQTETKDTMSHLEKLMDQLPEKQKLVLHLRDVEGLTYQEIEETLELPMSQVKVNLFRARKKMQEQILASELGYGY